VGANGEHVFEEDSDGKKDGKSDGKTKADGKTNGNTDGNTDPKSLKRFKSSNGGNHHLEPVQHPDYLPPITFDDLFTDFNPVPLGAASIGQVHEARLRATGEAVVLAPNRGQ
jgi:hypothetical protein